MGDFCISPTSPMSRVCHQMKAICFLVHFVFISHCTIYLHMHIPPVKPMEFLLILALACTCNYVLLLGQKFA